MRVEQLEYTAAIARFGSFRRAAEELHISQPALSETVRKLERELGVDILDRQRTGAVVSAGGRELLPHLLDVIEASKRLRFAADEQQSAAMVRVGAVSAATSPLLTAAVRAFGETHADVHVEVVLAERGRLRDALLRGGLDLGLVNYLDDDEIAPKLRGTELLRGHPVVCIRPDSPLAARPAIAPDELVRQPLIALRAGYAMDRYVKRLLDGRVPSFSYSTDGAETGKLMVANGLGVTVLPSYSVVGDPLEARGAITHRPIAGDAAGVRLVAERRRGGARALAARELLDVFVAQAAVYARGADGG